MPNYSKVSPKRNGSGRKTQDNFNEEGTYKASNESADLLFGGTFEAVPGLNSPKMNRRFARRLKHLLDKM